MCLELLFWTSFDLNHHLRVEVAIFIPASDCIYCDLVSQPRGVFEITSMIKERPVDLKYVFNVQIDPVFSYPLNLWYFLCRHPILYPVFLSYLLRCLCFTWGVLPLIPSCISLCLYQSLLIQQLDCIVSKKCLRERNILGSEALNYTVSKDVKR